MLAPTARSLLVLRTPLAPTLAARASTVASIRALHSHGSLPSSLPKSAAKRTVTTSAPTPLERNEPRVVDNLPWPPKLRNTAWKDRKSAFTEIAPVYIWPGVVCFFGLVTAYYYHSTGKGYLELATNQEAPRSPYYEARKRPV
ncbi:hypothetical protein JCM3775_004259 [Rhodotorula graminis]